MSLSIAAVASVDVSADATTGITDVDVPPPVIATFAIDVVDVADDVAVADDDLSTNIAFDDSSPVIFSISSCSCRCRCRCRPPPPPFRGDNLKSNIAFNAPPSFDNSSKYCFSHDDNDDDDDGEEAEDDGEKDDEIVPVAVLAAVVAVVAAEVVLFLPTAIAVVVEFVVVVVVPSKYGGDDDNDDDFAAVDAAFITIVIDGISFFISSIVVGDGAIEFLLFLFLFLSLSLSLPSYL